MSVTDTAEQKKPAVAPPIQTRESAVSILNRIAFSRHPAKVVLLSCLRALIILVISYLLILGIIFLALQIKHQEFSSSFLRWSWFPLIAVSLPLIAGIISAQRPFQQIRNGTFFVNKTDHQLIEHAYDLRFQASKMKTPRGFVRALLKSIWSDFRTMLRYFLFMGVATFIMYVVISLRNS